MSHNARLLAAIADVERTYQGGSDEGGNPKAVTLSGSPRSRVESAVRQAEARYASEERGQTREEVIAEVYAERVAEMDAEREVRTGRMVEELAQAGREKRLNPPAHTNPKTLDVTGESTRATGGLMGANAPDWSIEQQIERD